jgi:hypothetical protein
MRNHYSNDPRWLTARFAGKCSTKDCGARVKPGDRVFYYPSSKAIYAQTCGHADDNARDFAAASFDEEGY